MLPRLIQTLAVMLALAVSAAAAVAQTTITLRPSARLAEGAQQVRLSDIAELNGPEAAALGDVIVAEQPKGDRDGWIRLDVGQVRTALDGHPGINWGKLTLRGGRCAVRVGTPVQPSAPSRASELPNRKTGEPIAIDTSGPATVRTGVATKLASANGVAIDAIRLGFDPADAAVLDTLTGGRIVDLDLGASPQSPRVPVRVNVYSGDRLVLSHTLQVDVLVRRPMLVAAATLERGRTLEPADVRLLDQWVIPGQSAVPTIEDAAGSETKARIAAGKVIDREDLAAPLACKRGDTVYVHCVSGSVIVKMKARALGQARDGEVVQLKAENGEASFTARMSGRGRAVLTVQGGDPHQSIFGHEDDQSAAKRGRKKLKDDHP